MYSMLSVNLCRTEKALRLQTGGHYTRRYVMRSAAFQLRFFLGVTSSGSRNPDISS